VRDSQRPRHLTLCERCGEALYLKCRRCGERNTRDRRYCAICGRSLRGLFRWRQKDKRRFAYLILGAVIAVGVGYVLAKTTTRYRARPAWRR
jgi:ribosomal protein L37E